MEPGKWPRLNLICCCPLRGAKNRAGVNKEVGHREGEEGGEGGPKEKHKACTPFLLNLQHKPKWLILKQMEYFEANSGEPT